MHVPAAAAAAGTAATAKWLFNYNRENFQFDSEMRFSRFMTSRNFLNAQVEQYREDVRNIVELTQAKMDVIMMVGTLLLCACSEFNDAGRIGMHGVAPPEWFCGLYAGHIFSTVLYVGTALWLAMHGSLRAQCAKVSLLTRKVRLPIPSMDELDNARTFGSAYEKQRFGDIFRVPFMKHQEAAPEAPEESTDEDEELAHDKKHRKQVKKAAGRDYRVDFGSTTRETVPTWIRDEQVVDKGSVSCPQIENRLIEEHETPEHFKMIARAQEEWWQYDVYARVMLLYGTIQFSFAVCYYTIGTTTSELRGFWISWSLPMLFIVAQVLILRLDIIRGSGNHFLPHGEWFGHLAPYVAIAATTLEYRYVYSHFSVVLSWICVFLTYFGHIVMAARMLDLAWPDWHRSNDFPEQPGHAWWPSSWRIPSAFGKHLWLLAPPKTLKKGQHDLLNEMEGLARFNGGVVTRRRRARMAGKRPKKVTLEALQAQLTKLERLFQWWFEEKVWAQVPDDGQRHLTDLWQHYEAARREVIVLQETVALGSKGDVFGLKTTDGSPLPQVAQMDAEGTVFSSARKVRFFFDKTADNSSSYWNKKKTSIQDADQHLNELSDIFFDITTGLADVDTENRKFVTMEGSPENPYDGAYTTVSPFKEFSTQRAPDLPWQVTRVAICGVIVTWLYMLIAMFVVMLMGADRFVKEPGLPPWIRDVKNRDWTEGMWHKSNMPLPAGYRLQMPARVTYDFESPQGFDIPGLTEASMGPETLRSIGVAGENGKGERRLATESALRDLFKMLPNIEWLADEIRQSTAQEVASLPITTDVLLLERPAFMAPNMRTLRIAWPSFFEPQHLICHAGSVIAMTSRGFSAMATPTLDGEVESTPFSLVGIAQYGSFAGVAWRADGLEIITRTGDFLFCAGDRPQNSRWVCQPSEVLGRLPLDSESKLMAAALSEVDGDTRRRILAIILKDTPSLITLFEQSSSTDGWSPIGELQSPHSQVSLSFSGHDLLIASDGGEVLQRSVDTKKSVRHPPLPRASHPVHELVVRSVCATSTHKTASGLLRLSLRRQADAEGYSWVTDLVAE